MIQPITIEESNEVLIENEKTDISNDSNLFSDNVYKWKFFKSYKNKTIICENEYNILRDPNEEVDSLYNLSITKDNYLKTIKEEWEKDRIMEYLKEINEDDLIYIVIIKDLAEYNKFFIKDHMLQLPYGIINKSITGLGATTLEMDSKRNSIIVTPTKTLAYSKSKRKQNYFYVGSPVNSENESPVNIDDIKNYLSLNTVEYKKIFVVADSLKKVIEALEAMRINYKEEYHIFVDEVDKFMLDSGFRESLENAIDYYFLFNKENRTMITATMADFSHPKILNETRTDFWFKLPKRDLKLYATSDVRTRAIEIITEIIKKNPDDKIFVAYISVANTKSIIAELIKNSINKDKIGMACSSSRSKEIGIEEYYVSLEEGEKLPKQIVFTTNTNFVGIDLSDKYHLISISGISKEHHVLCPSDLIQIYGRNRDKQGTLTDTFIFETRDLVTGSLNEKAKENLKNKATLKKEIMDIAEALCEFANKYISIKRIAKNDIKVDDILPLMKLIKSDDYNIRLNIEREIAVAYFLIDSNLEKEYIYREMYNSLPNASKMLKESKLNLKNYNIDYYQDANQMSNSKYTKQVKADKDEERSRCYQLLEEYGNKPDHMIRQSLKRDIKCKDSNIAEMVKKVNELASMIDLMEAIRLVKIYYEKTNDERVYSSLYNASLFASLPVINRFKTYLTSSLPVGEKFDKKQLTEFLNEAIKNESIEFKEGDNYKLKFLNTIFETRTINQGKKGKNGESIERIEIISHYKYDLSPCPKASNRRTISASRIKNKCSWKGGFFK